MRKTLNIALKWQFWNFRTSGGKEEYTSRNCQAISGKFQKVIFLLSKVRQNVFGNNWKLRPPISWLRYWIAYWDLQKIWGSREHLRPSIGRGGEGGATGLQFGSILSCKICNIWINLCKYDFPLLANFGRPKFFSGPEVYCTYRKGRPVHSFFD